MDTEKLAVGDRRWGNQKREHYEKTAQGLNGLKEALKKKK